MFDLILFRERRKLKILHLTAKQLLSSMMGEREKRGEGIRHKESRTLFVPSVDARRRAKCRAYRTSCGGESLNSVSKAAVLPARTSAASPSAADSSTDSPTKKRSGPTYSSPISPPLLLLLLLLLHRSSLNPYTETGGS